MSKRSYAHNKAQREGKKRDNYTCQACGSTIRPEGHHILDFQFGGAADKDNIITLCQNCHKKLHKGELDIIVF
jgi:5-methylcytosine-specific restriction endonuclease McrA